MHRSQQIAVGPIVVAFGALLLLVSLFLNWYEPGFTAWTVFEALDLLLAALALASLAMAAQALGVGLPGARLPSGALLGVAVAALVIVVSQVINPPPAAVDSEEEVGVWLALGAVLVLAAGAALGSSYVSVVRVGEPGEPASTGPAPHRPGAPPPAAEPPEGEAPTSPMPPRSGPEPPA